MIVVFPGHNHLVFGLNQVFWGFYVLLFFKCLFVCIVIIILALLLCAIIHFYNADMVGLI